MNKRYLPHRPVDKEVVDSKISYPIDLSQEYTDRLGDP